MSAELPKMPIPGFDGYFCDQQGQVFRGERPLAKRRNRTGYVCFCVRVTGSTRTLMAHRATALAWLGLPPPGKPCVAHMDGERSNNDVSNLQWVSYAENEAHKKLHGTHGAGLKNVQSKVDEAMAEEVLKARARGLEFLEIGALFGISNSIACDICRGLHWTTAGKVAPYSDYERRLEIWRQKHAKRKERRALIPQDPDHLAGVGNMVEGKDQSEERHG